MASIPIRRKPEPECPECGKKMRVVESPQNKFRPFWGCCDFPKCFGKLEIDDAGVPIEDEFDDWLEDEDD